MDRHWQDVRGREAWLMPDANGSGQMLLWLKERAETATGEPCEAISCFLPIEDTGKSRN